MPPPHKHNTAPSHTSHRTQHKAHSTAQHARLAAPTCKHSAGRAQCRRSGVPGDRFLFFHDCRSPPELIYEGGKPPPPPPLSTKGSLPGGCVAAAGGQRPSCRAGAPRRGAMATHPGGSAAPPAAASPLQVLSHAPGRAWFSGWCLFS